MDCGSVPQVKQPENSMKSTGCRGPFWPQKARVNRRQANPTEQELTRTNRICLGRFLDAVANLKLAYGSPDALDHTGAKVFYHRVVALALATGVLGPRLTPLGHRERHACC